jgi:hypothetical protein
MDLQMQRYRGEDYLTFWAGSEAKGHGQGVYYMVSIIDIDGFLICTPASGYGESNELLTPSVVKLRI